MQETIRNMRQSELLDSEDGGGGMFFFQTSVDFRGLHDVIFQKMTLRNVIYLFSYIFEVYVTTLSQSRRCCVI
jgi:hypothetical protein